MNEGPESVNNMSSEERMDADRKNLDADTFWMRHGTPNVNLEQARKLAKNTPGFVRSMGQVLSGEYTGADDFEAMNKTEVAEVALMVITEGLHVLQSAIKDEEMTHEAAQAFIVAARLPMAEAGKLMAELAEIPSGRARYENR